MGKMCGALKGRSALGRGGVGEGWGLGFGLERGGGKDKEERGKGKGGKRVFFAFLVRKPSWQIVSCFIIICLFRRVDSLLGA